MKMGEREGINKNKILHGREWKEIKMKWRKENGEMGKAREQAGNKYDKGEGGKKIKQENENQRQKLIGK